MSEVPQVAVVSQVLLVEEPSFAALEHEVPPGPALLVASLRQEVPADIAASSLLVAERDPVVALESALTAFR